MRTFTKCLIVLLPLLFVRCHDDSSSDSRCQLEPDPGPCKAYIERYYYDKAEKRCKAFVWGGCEGVVPFETLAECENGCPGKPE
jgi:hypothetical protein